MCLSMDARLVMVLLRCVQSTQSRFTLNVSLDQFVKEYGRSVGALKGQSIYMDEDQKTNVRNILASEGVDAKTPPDSWKGLTRAEALEFSNNEKFSREPVKRNRVAVKSLLSHGLPLVINNQNIFLPTYDSHLEIDYTNLILSGHRDGISNHDWIVVVENWECFNDINRIDKRVELPGKNPLVVWRGDKDDVRADSLIAFLRAINQPVAAFVDYDPAGMMIAMSLPRLEKVLAPSLDVLNVLLKKKGKHNLYSKQLPMYQAKLMANTISCVDEVWQLIHEHGRGLPQENLIF
jgi:hypothetical protein